MKKTNLTPSMEIGALIKQTLAEGLRSDLSQNYWSKTSRDAVLEKRNDPTGKEVIRLPKKKSKKKPMC